MPRGGRSRWRCTENNGGRGEVGRRTRERRAGEKGAGEVIGIVACVFDLQRGPRHRAAGEATAAAAWARTAWRQCSLSPLCTVRNFPEGSGKFRATRNRSGKIRVIPDDQFLAEKASFYLGISTNPKFSENIHGGSHNHIEAPHDFSLKFWKTLLGSKMERNLANLISHNYFSLGNK